MAASSQRIYKDVPLKDQDLDQLLNFARSLLPDSGTPTASSFSSKNVLPYLCERDPPNTIHEGVLVEPSRCYAVLSRYVKSPGSFPFLLVLILFLE